MPRPNPGLEPTLILPPSPPQKVLWKTFAWFKCYSLDLENAFFWCVQFSVDSVVVWKDYLVRKGLLKKAD